MRSLLDVNVLVALLDGAHLHHRVATDWLAAHVAQGWASCPLTQNGFVRILSQPKYPTSMSVDGALDFLHRVTCADGHAFWPDDISLTDPQLFNQAHILGPKQLTDIYLLALAMKNSGRLVTFDRAIPLAAVCGAESRHVVVI